MVVTRKKQVGWKNLQKGSRFLCDKRIPIKCKKKEYRTIIRKIVKYGLEAIQIKKSNNNMGLLYSVIDS